MQSERWIVVADSPFLPATGGGEREHLGFVRAATRAGVLALLVIPSEGPLEEAPYRTELGAVPLLATPRRKSPLRLVHPRFPYVVASRPPPPWLTGQARAIAPDATGVVTFSYKSRLIGERLAVGLGLPAVLRQHNDEAAYHRSLAEGTPGLRGLVLRWEALRIRHDERRLVEAPWLSGIADISLADAQSRGCPRGLAVAHVPPFALDPTLAVIRGPAPADRSKAVLFLGALDVATNTTALDWLLDQVWPRVLAADPAATLEVVGRSPSAALRRRLDSARGVTLHADVPDVRPFLSLAAVAVNPAVSGSGVNIKVVEYLQAGVPLVSTSLATRGIELRPGLDLEVRDDAAGFASAVVELLCDPPRARAMAETGRHRIVELLDPERNLARMDALLHARG